MSKPLRVLIIEDSAADAQLMVRDLRKGGYDPTFELVETVEAMNEALDKQSWDVILSDYVMPRFSGLAALELVQKRGIDIPFIVVSGKIGEDVAVEVMKAGAHDYLLKGNLTRLAPAIERELQDVVVRRERRQVQEERDRLLVQLREVNEKLVLTSIQAKQQTEELDAIINSIAEALVVYGPSGEIVRMNSYAEGLLGYSATARPEPLTERLSLLQIENEDGRPIPPEGIPINKALKGEAVHGMVLSMLRQTDRRRIWLSISAAPIHGIEDKISGAVLVMTDVTSLHESPKIQ